MGVRNLLFGFFFAAGGVPLPAAKVFGPLITDCFLHGKAITTMI